MSAPVATFRAAAAVLGMSEDTLKRHRNKYGDQTKEPRWKDEAEVWAWYRAMTAPRPVPERPQKGKGSKVARLDGPYDPLAHFRQLTSG